MKKLNTILLLLGCVLLAVLLRTIGVRELWRELSSLGWGLVPFIAIEGIAEMIHTLGWRHCLSGTSRSSSWFRLFRIRMAGYAINYLTPTAALGGEVTKTTLLASTGSVPEAASGVIIGKVCFGLAHVIFVALGAVVVVQKVRLAPAVWISLLCSAALVACGIVAFLLLQKYGKLGSLIRWLASRHIGGPALAKAASAFTSVDEQLRAFYRERPRDLLPAIAWHLAGYSTGIVQVWLFLQVLQPPASFSVAAAIWLIGMWFDLLTFAVPMNIGSLEGTRVLSFGLLGYGSPVGMAYGIALRLAQIFWAAVGLVFYALLNGGKKSVVPQALKPHPIP
jgi:uncharacterized protein (TIRG00374 family)